MKAAKCNAVANAEEETRIESRRDFESRDDTGVWRPQLRLQSGSQGLQSGSQVPKQHNSKYEQKWADMTDDEDEPPAMPPARSQERTRRGREEREEREVHQHSRTRSKSRKARRDKSCDRQEVKKIGSQTAASVKTLRWRVKIRDESDGNSIGQADEKSQEDHRGRNHSKQTAESNKTPRWREKIKSESDVCSIRQADKRVQEDRSGGNHSLQEDRSGGKHSKQTIEDRRPQKTRDESTLRWRVKVVDDNTSREE